MCRIWRPPYSPVWMLAPPPPVEQILVPPLLRDYEYIKNTYYFAHSSILHAYDSRTTVTDIDHSIVSQVGLFPNLCI